MKESQQAVPEVLRTFCDCLSCTRPQRQSTPAEEPEVVRVPALVPAQAPVPLPIQTQMSAPIQPGNSSNDSDGHASPIIFDVAKLPNELWVRILSKLSQKELVQARLVSKQWQEIVDNHFEFSVIVHEGKTDLDRVYDLRIRECLITRLLSDQIIIQYPSLLRRARFWGPINKACFQRIMNNALSLEELSLTAFTLMTNDLVGPTRLNGFQKVKKLELLGYMCKGASEIVAENCSKLLTYRMPTLEKLTMNIHCNIFTITSVTADVIEFISRSSLLRNVQVTLVCSSESSNFLSSPERSEYVVSSNPISDSMMDSLRKVKLAMLRVSTSLKDLAVWIAVLKTQNCLEDFRLQAKHGYPDAVPWDIVTPLEFEMVRETLLRNATSLVSVELKEFCLSVSRPVSHFHFPLDVGVFRYAANLKRLVLHRHIMDCRRCPENPMYPNIINLRMLPTTIEVLDIRRLSCLSEEIQFVCDVLENLKKVELIHTGSLTDRGVHGGIVESISSKTEIQLMNLLPLNFHSNENEKYQAVRAKFHMDDLGDHVYFDFELFRKGLPQSPRPRVDPMAHPEPVYMPPLRRSPPPEVFGGNRRARVDSSDDDVEEWEINQLQFYHFHNCRRRRLIDRRPCSHRIRKKSKTISLCKCRSSNIIDRMKASILRRDCPRSNSEPVAGPSSAASAVVENEHPVAGPYIRQPLGFGVNMNAEILWTDPTRMGCTGSRRMTKSISDLSNLKGWVGGCNERQRRHSL